MGTINNSSQDNMTRAIDVLVKALEPQYKIKTQNSNTLGYRPYTMTQSQHDSLWDFMTSYQLARKDHSQPSFQIVDILFSEGSAEENESLQTSHTNILTTSILLLREGEFESIQKEDKKRFLTHQKMSQINENVTSLRRGLGQFTKKNRISIDVISELDKNEAIIAYSYFRYFIARTILVYLAFPDQFNFGRLGISQFFDNLDEIESLKKMVSKITDASCFKRFKRFITSVLNFEIDLGSKKTLYDQVVHNAKLSKEVGTENLKQFIEIIEALKTSIDQYSHTILSECDSMPIACFQSLFDMSAFHYPSWSSAATTNNYDKKTIVVDLEKEILKDLKRDFVRKLNYLSYLDYKRLLGKHNVHQDKHLGAMVVHKFTFTRSAFDDDKGIKNGIKINYNFIIRKIRPTDIELSDLSEILKNEEPFMQALEKHLVHNFRRHDKGETFSFLNCTDWLKQKGAEK